MSNTWSESQEKSNNNNNTNRTDRTDRTDREMSSSHQYSPPVDLYTEESSTGKLSRKARDNPFFPIAMTGFGCAVLYGAYRFKYRGDMPVSLYLIHLRVGAQGMAIGSLSVGMIYMLGKRLYNRFYDIPNDHKVN